MCRDVVLRECHKLAALQHVQVRSDRLQGDPFFDLANFSINQRLSEDAQLLLIQDYEGAVTPTARARLGLLRLMSDFREAMWGVLQQGISTLDVDFVAYADEHFERLLHNASGVAFEAALAEAARG